jgi:hypothetical protein
MRPWVRTVLLTAAVSAVVSSIVTFALVAWAGPWLRPSVITAQRFEVIDQDGRTKAYLGGPPYNDSLGIMDADGVERIRLTVLADNTAMLLMSDAQHRVRAAVYVNSQGATDAAFLDADGRSVQRIAAPSGIR